jgi:hypothetical protein
MYKEGLIICLLWIVLTFPVPIRLAIVTSVSFGNRYPGSTFFQRLRRELELVRTESSLIAADLVFSGIAE